MGMKQEESLEAKAERHRALDKRIKELQGGALSRVVNDDTIKRLKHQKLKLKQQIQQIQLLTAGAKKAKVQTSQPTAIAA